MEEKEKTLTAKESLFIEEYLVDFNATQAAIRAGYSKKTATAIGYENLRKPHIEPIIRQKIKERQIDAESTKKIISDIAKGNLNKYIKITKVEHTPRVEKHLNELITELKEEIAFESEYASLAELTEEEFDTHLAKQDKRRKQILRYELELRRDPDAKRIVYGKTEWIDTAEFDLVALAKDKEAGIVKSFKMTKDGPQIEFCSIDSQLSNMARIHGLFKDNVDLNMTGNIDPTKWLEANNTGNTND